MRPLDAGALCTLTGVLALRVGLTDQLLDLLRPGMRPWLAAAGAVLSAVGVALLGQAAARARRARVSPGAPGSLVAEPEHRVSPVGWLLLLPLVVGIVVAPGALGAYAAGRSGDIRNLPTRQFDLDQYLRAAEVSGTTASLPMLDYLAAATDPHRRGALTDHAVRLTGFVTAAPGGAAHEFLLTRFLVSCCAADATAMRVDVHGVDAVPPEETWIEADVRLAPGAGPPVGATLVAPPNVIASAVHVVDEPAAPYEYPTR